MRVRVVERGHEQFAAPVVHLAVRRGVRALRCRAAEVGDAAIGHAHPLMGAVVKIFVKQVDIREQHAHLHPLRTLVRLRVDSF